MDIDITTFSPDSAQLADQAVALLCACFPTHNPLVLWSEVDRVRYGYGIVADTDGQVVGVATGRKVADGRLFVVYVGVGHTFRRRGVATRLLDRLVHVAGTADLELFVDVDNIAAQSLYAGRGLAPVAGTIRRGQQTWRGRWNALDNPAFLQNVAGHSSRRGA